MSKRPPPDILQGTLDLLILRTLQREPMHGWAIGSDSADLGGCLQVNQGSLYPALHRLEHRGWIEAEWGISELECIVTFVAAHKENVTRVNRRA